MNNVFCLFVGSYDERDLKAVFTTKELALAAARSWKTYDSVDVEEHMVDCIGEQAYQGYVFFCYGPNGTDHKDCRHG